MRPAVRCGGRFRPTVHFILKYSRLGASSRLRALQFIPGLVAAGFDVTSDSLLDDSYLRRLYRGQRPPYLRVASALLRRAVSPPRADAVYVQYESLPYAPFALESSLYRQPVVADFDDAIHVHYRTRPWLRDKISRVMSAARHVVVGNEILRRYALAYNSNVTLIPTVVDTTAYTARTDFGCRERRPVVGWVGTPKTCGYLYSVHRELALLHRRIPFTLRLVGAPPDFQLPGLDCDIHSWSEEQEASLIATFDAGIMPLTDDPFSQGKCGYKLIQYMGCAVPPVGSAIGANNTIIRHGHNGLLAASPGEFAAALGDLLSSECLRAQLGQSARRTVEERYSLESALPAWVRIFSQLTAFREREHCGGDQLQPHARP